MDDILPKLLHFPPHPPPPTPMSDAQYEEAVIKHISVVSSIPDKSLMLHTSGDENPLDVGFTPLVLIHHANFAPRSLTQPETPSRTYTSSSHKYMPTGKVPML